MPRRAAVDALRQEQASAAVQVLGIVGFALLTALGAQVRFYIWEVPVTLQTLAVYGSGLYLGWRSGMLSQLLYLAVGLFFPVFAGDGFGPAYLFGAVTAGYLLAMPLAAGVVGLLSRRFNTLAGSTVSMLAGSLVIFTVGVSWLALTGAYDSFAVALQRGWLPFIPIDLMKIMGVGLLYTATRRIGR